LALATALNYRLQNSSDSDRTIDALADRELKNLETMPVECAAHGAKFRLNRFFLRQSIWSQRLRSQLVIC